jgi:hypothetical protein
MLEPNPLMVPPFVTLLLAEPGLAHSIVAWLF